MNDQKLTEYMGVERDNPVLLGVLELIKQQGEISEENLLMPRVTNDERNFYSGGLAAARDIAMLIMTVNEKARIAKASGPKEKKNEA